MSSIQDGPEAQDLLFERSSKETAHVPAHLSRATLRLQFPPTYVVVGVYRLFMDKTLWVPAWEKCKHATQRGALVGATWAVLTFSLQRKFIEIFMANSARVTGLSNRAIFGFKVPFGLHTYAAILLVGSQLTFILRYFLSKNIRIARDRAWAQTITSRGKGPEFWGPYVEEWENPPKVVVEKYGGVKRWVGGRVGLFFVRRVLLLPFEFYPFVGTAISAWFKALGTAHYLHTQYFDAKKMSEYQIAVFMEERKWDYRLFGFSAALLEGLPIIGLVFTVSNRIGAAMWAHDLEKKQHFVAAERLKRDEKRE
ncbi:hypothetical protein BDZ94DRAFT_1200543 [Collybia nuda]|uniref:Uncharacterized protein n=1 Tax=Collybia nuda TaxID=64659 RepID=A0A9P6CE41_9AGAR|nr:hypothetical protein BDZ94DRAFT_1200543 [Collybia nuda]